MSETYLEIRPRFSDHYYESHAVSQLFVVAIAEFQPHGYFLVVILVTYNLPMLMYICSILLSLLFNLLLTYLLTYHIIDRQNICVGTTSLAGYWRGSVQHQSVHPTVGSTNRLSENASLRKAYKIMSANWWLSYRVRDVKLLKLFATHLLIAASVLSLPPFAIRQRRFLFWLLSHTF